MSIELKINQIIENKDQLTEDEKDIVREFNFTPKGQRSQEMIDKIEFIWERVLDGVDNDY